ncbi:flavodoxin [Coprobacillus sp. AF33-1AC]|uniref:flavodoxin n=1 Tax=Coprobacillus sp. AF33-1AC TaxID=2292032 RepID=UPI001F31A8B1|nr:flavodoxin [Coprobacillus sp. AF33-1AC]
MKVKKGITILIAIFMILGCSACKQKTKEKKKTSNVTQSDLKTANSDSLIVYFSWSGHTRDLAKMIQKETKGDLFEIVPVKAYSDDYDTVVDQAKQEQKDKARPQIAYHIDHLDKYQTIYVGYPNWWQDMPMILYSFFDEYDLSHKKIVPFCTSGGSGLSQTVETIKKLEPEADVTEGFHVGSDDVDQCQQDLKNWLNKIN